MGWFYARHRLGRATLGKVPLCKVLIGRGSIGYMVALVGWCGARHHLCRGTRYWENYSIFLDVTIVVEERKKEMKDDGGGH